MINNIIKEQLLKCKTAVLNIDKDNPYIINIPKHEDVQVSLDECYLIELDDSLLNSNNDDLITCNWNHGNVPKVKFLKIDVIKILGKMINVNSVGYSYEDNKDLDYVWSGWLPIKKIKILYKL